MRWRASMRVRITAAAVIIIAITVVVGGTLLVRAHRSSLTSGVEDAARLRARDLAGVIRAGTLTPRIAGSAGDETFAQVVDPAGAVIAASANIEGQPRISRLRPGHRGYAVTTVGRLPVGDSSFRIVARRVVTSSGAYTIYVAGALEKVEESTSSLTRLLLLALPALLAIVGAATWVLTGRALRPVERIRQEVEAIRAKDLHRRVPEPSTGDEIERLARTMNAMLARLEASNESQRRFVADASHELRSPLASIRAQLEVSLAYPDRGDRTAIDREMLTDTIRLQRLVDDLLLLSRVDGAKQVTTQRVPVDLDAIVLREARRLRATTGHRIDTTRVSGAQVVGDPDQLTRVVRNLLDNAARHAASRIWITLAETDPGARFTVTDDGPGIPPGQEKEIFRRFTRLDDARARDNGGSGLGLAITHAIVEAHGGTISVENAPGASFCVTFP